MSIYKSKLLEVWEGGLRLFWLVAVDCSKGGTQQDLEMPRVGCCTGFQGAELAAGVCALGVEGPKVSLFNLWGAGEGLGSGL